MPYIDPAFRYEMDPNAASDPKTPGDLNFQITRLLDGYMYAHRLSYQTINDILGALEGAKLEFYRRVAVPYEDAKRDVNGDVYSRGHAPW